MVKTKEVQGTHRAHRFASLSALLLNFRPSPRCASDRGTEERSPRPRKLSTTSVRRVARSGTPSWTKDTTSTACPLQAQGPGRGGDAPRGCGGHAPGLSPAEALGGGEEVVYHQPHHEGSQARRPPLKFTVHVVVRYQMGRKWRAHGCQHFISAVFGDLPLKTVADRYRGRFRTKSSYRILGQATAWTTSRSPALRLLHVAVGMMLPNEWVILNLHYASEGRQGPTGFVVREEPAVREAPEPAAESRGVQARQRQPRGESAAASSAPSPSRAIGQLTGETLPSTGVQYLHVAPSVHPHVRGEEPDLQVS